MFRSRYAATPAGAGLGIASGIITGAALAGERRTRTAPFQAVYNADVAW